MTYKLIIVESPTKVESLSKYLKSEGDYKVASSMGHIRDLPAKKGMNIDIDNDFKPNYVISSDKKKIVKNLKDLSRSAEEIIMASDGDREGEAIAWHLCHALGLDIKTTKRIVFHEITATALKAALKDPRNIDQNLVDAQQARRILDRIVGFELSPILWRKIQKPGLSAGRVQSVAVRLIYEKEKEIEAFTPKINISGQARFEIKSRELPAELKEPLVSLAEGQKLLETLQNAEFKVIESKLSPGKKSPGPPFKTSTLQQEAANRLSFSVKQTMRAAQILYEKGYITYMRTDSLNLSQQSLKSAENYIVKTYGEKYAKKRTYQTKSKDAQEAHEAIRPTDFKLESVSDVESSAGKLYGLIWQRTLASQMSDAQIDNRTIVIGSKQTPTEFVAKGHSLRFDGFLKVIGRASADVILPEIEKDDRLTLVEMKIFEKFSNPPARYSEASLVKTLEELGIGRPSTYAPTIGTIVDRGYVFKGDVEAKTRTVKGFILQNNQIESYSEEDKWGGATNRLIPENLTQLVIPFLIEYFADIMDYNFTSNIETDFDKIAVGKLDWVSYLDNFYKKFHPKIETAAEADRNKIQKMRQVGLDPKDQKMIYARWGRYGPMLQKGLAEDSEEKPAMANLPKDSTIENVTLEQALKMFELPRLVGKTQDGREIRTLVGPYGAYLSVEGEAGKKINISLKDSDPFTVTQAEAEIMIKEKEAAEKKKMIADFGKIQIINGPYGPYITDGSKNCKIPKKEDDKEVDPYKITEEQAQKWLDKDGRPIRKKGRRKR